MYRAQPLIPSPSPEPVTTVNRDADADVRELRASLDRRGPRLRFEPNLERAYERDTGAGRGKRIFLCNLLGTAVFGVLAKMDIEKLSHAAGTLEVLRMAVLIFCGVGLARQGLHWRHLSVRDREGLTAIGNVAMSAYVAFESHQARDVLGVMIGSHMMTIFLYSCLIARLRFPVAVCVTMTALVAYACGATAHDPLTHAIVLSYSALFVGAAIASLSANYLLERKERRSYLLQRLSLHQRDTVQQQAEALRKLTLCDPLTGLANRRRFDSDIDTLWHATPDAPVGLLQVDVDFFKRYNDTYGHPLGDVCLQRIGERLSDVAQSRGGLAARIGGEEFVLLLPDTGPARASAAAEELCRAIRGLAMPHSASTAAAFVTVSVGVASMRPVDAGTPQALMRAADLALYRAKREGRDRFAAAEPIDAAPDASHAAQPPEHPPRTQPELASSSTSAQVQQLSALLAAGARKLRFPPELEAVYEARKSLARQRRLAVLSFMGLISTCGYVWISLPLVSDIAPWLMQGAFVLCGALALPWVAVLQRPMPWRWREGLFSITTSLLLLGLLAMGAQSQSPGNQSSTLSLSLITIVATVIAAPPTRFAVPPLALLLAGVATLTWRSAPADLARWVEALTLLLATSVYSLIGACVLDLSNRRSYLLRRLGEAQIAELRGINEDLQRLALTDTLTRLPNRRHFESTLSELWEGCRSNDKPLALLIIDIDHFKLYNDNYGHLSGDACLQSVAMFIAQWCTQLGPVADQPVAAFAARLGGEEFGVLLPGHGERSALAAAAKLCAALQARRSPHAHSPVSDVLTASIGAASQRPSGSSDLRRLLRVADEALYRAKAEGRNRASL